MVGCTPDFERHPFVINGCSELFAQGLGIRRWGRGAECSWDGLASKQHSGRDRSFIRIASGRNLKRNMDWYTISNIAELDTPALVVYPDRVRRNIRRAIEMVGDPARLRPHVKTHKSPQVTRMMMWKQVSNGSSVQPSRKREDAGKGRGRRMSCWPINPLAPRRSALWR